MGSVVVVKPHKTVALPFVVMAMLCVMSAVIVAVHIPMYCIYVIITVLLTFDAHALQGYSSWLCLCVWFDFSYSMDWPRRPMDHLSTAKDSSKTCFFVKQPLHKAFYRTLVEVTRAAVSHFVCLC